MNDKPETAWVEAAQIAASRVFEAIDSMGDYSLDLKLAVESAQGSNSADSSFLDYLEKGEHLTGSFLADAR